MDETIINYYYFDTSNNVQEVKSTDYYTKLTNDDKPLKLEYTIKYNNDGTPYNNLNITSDISRNIFIFKTNELGNNPPYSHHNISKVYLNF